MNPDDATLQQLRPLLEEYKDFGGLGPSEGLLTHLPLPVTERPGDDKDFMWQRHPFESGYKLDNQGQDEFDEGDGHAEASGIDYLLSYWMAAYSGLLQP